jgi:hypothetical protein
MTKNPKGYLFARNIHRLAYIEFETKAAAEAAKMLSESLFRGRQITVMAKRKNVPGRG